MFVKHQEAELSEDEVGRILQGSKIKTQVKVCKFKDFQNVFVSYAQICLCTFIWSQIQ